MNTIPRQGILHTTVHKALRSVRHRRYSRDIVSFGVLKKSAATDRTLMIHLEINSAKPETGFQVQGEVREVLQALPELRGFDVEIEVRNGSPASGPAINGCGPPLSSLQEEVQGEGGLFDPDPMITAMARPDLAPSAGDGEDGPLALGGPMGDRTFPKWAGPVAVFQWEVDPLDSSRDYRESELEPDGWIFPDMVAGASIWTGLRLDLSDSR